MKDITNRQALHWLGDDSQPPVGTGRDRFGNSARLYSLPAGSMQSPQISGQTFVATQTYAAPIPWGLQVRFSTNGTTWSNRYPLAATCDLVITVSSAYDQLGGRATESYQLDDDFRLPPVCMVIASQLEVTARAIPHVPDAGPVTNGDVFVRIVAAPLDSIACDDIRGTEDETTGYSHFANSNFFPEPDVGREALAANPDRKQFILNNRTNMNVTVKFGDLPLVVGGEATFVMLPGWVYESPTTGLYKGRVVVVSEEGDETPDGFFLAGEGT